MSINQISVLSGQVAVGIGAVSGTWALVAIGFSLQLCAIYFALEKRD